MAGIETQKTHNYSKMIFFFLSSYFFFLLLWCFRIKRKRFESSSRNGAPWCEFYLLMHAKTQTMHSALICRSEDEREKEIVCEGQRQRDRIFIPSVWLCVSAHEHICNFDSSEWVFSSWNCRRSLTFRLCTSEYIRSCVHVHTLCEHTLAEWRKVKSKKNSMCAFLLAGVWWCCHFL